MILHCAAYNAFVDALRRRQVGLPQRPPFGLSQTQWHDLRSVAWRPGQPIQLGFGDACRLPGALMLADGGRLPILARRSAHGRLHAAWMLAANVSCPSVEGTVTALVRHRQLQTLYALTSGHVLAASPNAAPGDRVVLRESQSGQGVNGKLVDWTPSFHIGQPDTALDAGLTRLEQDQARDLIEYGMPLSKGVAEARIGERLSLRTRGMAIPLDVLGYETAVLSLGKNGGDIRLVSGLSYSAQILPEEGDSGAPLWNDRERIAAMHTGGLIDNAGNGIAVPILKVLDWCNCAVLDRGMPLHAPANPPLTAAAAAPPSPAMPNEVQLVLARTLWGEARGEGSAGMEAVACVVLNRVKRQTYWGKSVIEVCRKPYQFSCWNQNDRNYAAMLKLDANAAELADAYAIAGRAIANVLSIREAFSDSTNGATHYHARTLSPLPRWARGHATCARIGNHLFYNDIN
ncbi:cell wall hydrolase [Massilia sp. BJB1822]|uniref:cell wall hydrolase n=1 Tax=Massilia sp. BJB1822 TaxID=2744470 RepID=UPI001C3DE328|nr:cell wall hydrolase [Massilia sp. BJB1822]